ncbi:MAG: hypothetical protein C4305_08780, partial [Thermoleophilia bacterium]
PSLALLAVATGGAAGTVLSQPQGSEKTIVALTPLPPAPETLPLGPRLIPWPGHAGFTIVLAAVPTRAGLTRARREAMRALRAGLPEVGILVSSRYPDLHPGYYLVFSGVYDSLEEAQTRLPRASARFPGAFARQIAR